MRKKILIIEKDINLAYSLQTQFLIVEMDVQLLDDSSGDADFVLNKIIEYDPDYIIVDLFLEKINSADLISKIKKNTKKAKLLSYLYRETKDIMRPQDYNVDYCYTFSEMTPNEFAMKTIRIINNLESVKKK